MTRASAAGLLGSRRREVKRRPARQPEQAEHQRRQTVSPVEARATGPHGQRKGHDEMPADDRIQESAPDPLGSVPAGPQRVCSSPNRNSHAGHAARRRAGQRGPAGPVGRQRPAPQGRPAWPVAAARPARPAPHLRDLLEDAGIPARVIDELMEHAGGQRGKGAPSHDGSLIGTRYRWTTPEMEARMRFEPLASSVRVISGSPLCRPAFPQVDRDRQRRSHVA
jgi:hypothetical protein